MKITENKIEVNNLKINYVEAGKGKPMIFLHNGGGFWQSWYYQVTFFAKTHKVYALDWPGFGDSELPEEPLSLDLLHSVLEGFITKLSLREVILVGNCIGGSAALKYSVSKAKNVSKLVIFNICPGELFFSSKLHQKLVTGSNQFPRRKKLIQNILKFAFTKTPLKYQFPKVLFGDKYDSSSVLFKKYIEKFKTEKQTTSRINLLFSVDTYTLEKIIEGKTVPPHLLIWGKENKVTSLESHGKFHRDKLSPKQFNVIDNTGHLCMYESPTKVNEIISNFLIS